MPTTVKNSLYKPKRERYRKRDRGKKEKFELKYFT